MENDRKTLVSLLNEHAGLAPDAPFVVHLESGTTVSYGKTLETARKLSALLAQLGIGRKSRVAFGVRNHWLFYPLLLACSSRRATLVPFDPELHRDELAFLLSHASPELTITADRASLPSTSGNGTGARLSLSEVVGSLDSVADPPPELCEGVPSDVILMIYTSGTTGSGKSVMLTDANLVANATSLVNRYKVAARDRFYCTLPTHHMNAIMITGMVPLVAGARIYLSDILSFKNAKLFWKSLSELEVTICSMVPSIMALLVKLFPQGANAPIANLRFGFCGAAPLPATTWKQFEEVFGFPVYQGYGLTETTCWAVSTPMEGPRRWDTVGTLMDCEVRIDTSQIAEIETFLFDRSSPGQQDDRDEPAGAPARELSGEVLIRGPIVSAGYYKNRKLTSQSTTEDGFFRTGDLGFFDADGYLHISGRLKEIIIKNGANIFSRDVDQLLCQHEAVKECKTIGIHDDLVGERVYSACVLEDGRCVTEQDLRAWVQGRLSQQMWPDAIVLMGYLPSGAAGKVSINVLRKIVSGEMTETLVSTLNSWKHKRAQPSGLDQIRKTVQRSLLKGEPIRFLSYWGCGKRDSISEVDKMALERLREFIDGVRRVPQAPPALTLIFTDLHAMNNRMPRERMGKYFSEIQAQATRLGMDTVFLSELWETAGLSPSQLDAEMSEPAFESRWQALPVRGRLIEQAGRHVEQGADPEAAARRYYLGCSRDAVVIAARYPSFMFTTYNHPDFDCLLPDLPKLYLYSYKEGTSVKPWFVDSY